MKIKKLCVLLLTFAMSCLEIGCSGTEKGSVFLDANGKIIGRVSSEYGSVRSDKEYNYDYLITAMKETTEIICRKQNVSVEKAYEYLYEENYTIQTEFNSNLQLKIYEILSGYEYEELTDYAVAITDLNGNLVASFSSDCDNENLINGSLKNRYPCSTLKPISVYAPLFEEQKITWSSVQTDTYIKYVKDSDGTKRRWPANMDGQYSNENVTVVDAIKESYNTVAVKWLQELTVSKSYEFLDKLGVNIEYEKNISNENSNDEVLGNLAMGYLRQGVTMVDMAGYYQMFANGGMYSKPTSVRTISREDKELYHKKTKQEQIIKPTTAYIMNKLLCDVVSSGTGKEAQVSGFQVGGKTGTSSENANNWFVGFTPQYSCAIWHGSYYKNNAPYIFSNLFNSIFKADDKDMNFPTCEDVHLEAYCVDSGGNFTEGCRRIGNGYYLVTDHLDSCNIHK